MKPAVRFEANFRSRVYCVEEEVAERLDFPFPPRFFVISGAHRKYVFRVNKITPPQKRIFLLRVHERNKIHASKLPDFFPTKDTICCSGQKHESDTKPTKQQWILKDD